MDLGIKDRVALVAAASKGIGFAAARELAREGARVFLCSRDAARASEAAEKINSETGTTVAGIAADVTDEKSVERFVELAREQAGHIDILVTNAGGPPTSTFADANLDMFRKAWELNGLSAIRLAKLVLPAMRAQKWGRIINVTSVSVKQPITLPSSCAIVNSFNDPIAPPMNSTISHERTSTTLRPFKPKPV